MPRNDYEVVMGLEVHAELATKTKIFCSCPTKFGAAPNTQVCPVCMAMPGTLPTLNEKVVELLHIVQYQEIVKMIEKTISIQIHQEHIRFHNLINHCVNMDI